MRVKSKLIFVCYVFLLIGFFLSTGVALYSQKSLSNDNEREVDTVLATKVYDTLRNELAEPVVAVSALAHDEFLIDFLEQQEGVQSEVQDVVTLKNFLKRIKTELDYDFVNLLSTKTMRYYTSDGFNKVVDFEHNKYDVWFKDFDKRKGDFSFDIGQNEFNNNEMTIFVNSKVKNKNDELIGVVAVSLGIYRLQRIIANYEKQYDIQISITDDEGNMLIDNDIQNLKGVHHLDISSRSTRKSNQYFFQKVSSTQNVISRFNKELGMYIVIRSNHTIFTNQFKFLWLINAILFGIVALLLALAIFIVNRNHSKLVKYSFVDEMTKLFNRRCYEEDLFDLNTLPQLDPDLLYIMAC